MVNDTGCSKVRVGLDDDAESSEVLLRRSVNVLFVFLVLCFSIAYASRHQSLRSWHICGYTSALKTTESKVILPLTRLQNHTISANSQTEAKPAMTMYTAAEVLWLVQAGSWLECVTEQELLAADDMLPSCVYLASEKIFSVRA